MKRWLFSIGLSIALIGAAFAAAPQYFQGGVQVVSPPNGHVTIDSGYPQSSVFNVASGTVTLNDSTPVTVANTNLTANSVVVFTLKTVGGTVGAYPTIQTVTPGTGFTVEGGGSDTSVYNYLIIG